MKLVCITGMAGTGKSTLAHNTVAALQERGQDAVYIDGRTRPVLSGALMNIGRWALLRRHDPRQEYGSYTAAKKQTMRNPVLATLYTIAILLDYYIQIWLKLRPHLSRDRVVVADCYLYDTVISDLAVHLNYTPAQAVAAVQFGLRLVPRPAMTILMNVPVEIAFARKDDAPHRDFLREQQTGYAQLLARFEVRPLSGMPMPALLVLAVLRVLETEPSIALKECVA